MSHVRLVAKLATTLGILAMAYPASAATPHYNDQGVFVFQYGAPTPPTVRCSPSKVCEIVLEQDESVYKIFCGDTVRWIINPSYAGPKANIPTVDFKPVDVGTQDDPLSTNLIIHTNKRTYEVNLEAAKKTAHTRYGFSYPQEAFTVTPTVNAPIMPPVESPMVQPTAMMQSGMMQRSQERTYPSGPPPRPDTYQINGNTDYRPLAVWNDGTHTYIQMPPKAPAPSIYTVASDGTIGMINFHPPINDVYTLDGTPNHIELVGSIGKKVPHIDILRQ